MKIQSLSVVVPNTRCINHCASCPSRMHDNDYPVLLDEMRPDFDMYLKDYIKRLEFARDNGCNTLMLTGTSEPQQNRKFLTWFGMMMQMMGSPFHSIEMQCTGVLLDEAYIRFLRRHVDVTTLALSVFSLCDDENRNIINPPKNWVIYPFHIAKLAKDAGMAVRVCLNLTKSFDVYGKYPQDLFGIMKYKGADQVTLRVLYPGKPDAKGVYSPESKWVMENMASTETVDNLKSYVKTHGTLLGKLPYGASKYALDGMSVVFDDDSMGKDPADADTFKYLVLRPDCKLYSSWDDKGSLVF